MRPAESFVGQPIRSLQTMLRVLAEDDDGYVPIIPDGIYGPETINAVSVFQSRHGLDVTGITDQLTWEQIVAEYEPALIRADAAQPLYVVLNPGQIIRKGERHPNIYLVQGMLAVLSEIYDSISAPSLTGLLDEATAEAIGSFQYLSGLPITGNVDKVTWKNLVSQYPLGATILINRGKESQFPV